VIGASVLPPDRDGGEQALLVRRQQPGQRVAALDHLEERLLLAVQVLVGALDDGDAEIEQEARAAQLEGRPPEGGHLGPVRRLGGEVHVAGADGEGGDGRPLHDAVRVPPHEEPILERGRLALGAVGHDVAPALAAVAHGAPLPPDREAGPAPAPEAGRRDLGDGAVGAQGDGGPEAVAAAGGEIRVDVGDGRVGQQEGRPAIVPP